MAENVCKMSQSYRLCTTSERWGKWIVDSEDTLDDLGAFLTLYMKASFRAQIMKIETKCGQNIF